MTQTISKEVAQNIMNDIKQNIKFDIVENIKHTTEQNIRMNIKKNIEKNIKKYLHPTTTSANTSATTVEGFDGIRKHNSRFIFGILLSFIILDLLYCMINE
jgi:hypothetical protein